ncbi:MAG: hypothetical protein M0T69_08195 [Deltaproteobacteria bacterium]|nr:hypothetical protein [Deltaproteobacteria bacterium]
MHSFDIDIDAYSPRRFFERYETMTVGISYSVNNRSGGEVEARELIVRSGSAEYQGLPERGHMLSFSYPGRTSSSALRRNNAGGIMGSGEIFFDDIGCCNPKLLRISLPYIPGTSRSSGPRVFVTHASMDIPVLKPSISRGTVEGYRNILNVKKKYRRLTYP